MKGNRVAKQAIAAALRGAGLAAGTAAEGWNMSEMEGAPSSHSPGQMNRDLYDLGSRRDPPALAPSQLKGIELMSGKLNGLIRGAGGLLASAAMAFAATNHPPVIVPDADGGSSQAYRLVWPTAPGVRYQPQQSPDLRGWATLGGYPKAAPGVADQYLFNAQSNQQFFRVLQLDEQPPAVAARDPEEGRFAVPRRARVAIRLEDQSAIDPASVRLAVGGLGEFTTNSPWLAFTNNTVVFDAAGAALGAYGERVTLSLAAADILGNRGTNTWSFDLETQPLVVSNLFVFGSAQAQKAGQRIGDIPAAVLAGRPGGAVKMDSGAHPWRLASVAPGRLVVAYTGNSAPAIPAGAYLSNLTPASTNEIFYRRVVSLSDDAASQRLTLLTEEATLESLVQQGALSVSPDSAVLNVGPDGSITKAFYLGATVAFPRQGFSLDGAEASLKGADDLEIAKLAAEELHWWFTPKLSAAMELALGKLSRFEAVASGNLDSAMVFSLDVRLLGVSREWLLFESLLKALNRETWIYIGNIGPVPVFAKLSFGIQLKARAEAKALLHFTGGLRQRGDLAAGFSFGGSQVDFIHTARFAPTDWAPFKADIQGELSFELSLEPALEFLVYGLAGVTVGITPSGKAVITASISPDEPLKGVFEAGVSLDLGLHGPALDFLKYLTPKPQLELSLPLWQEEWPWFPRDAIAIQTQPRSLVVREGEPAYFTCAASAVGTLAYQWFQDGVPLPGQTARTLLLPYASPFQAGEYQAGLKAGKERTNSAAATLKVLSPPAALAATAVATNGFTAHWGPVRGAEGYRLDVSSDARFGSYVVRDAAAGSGTSWAVGNLEASTTYYYRVRAYAGGIASSSSSPVSATTSKATDPPTTVPGMVWIPPGTFTMGSPASEKDRWADEGPQTVVTITKGFWMAKYETTQGEYQAVMGSNPSYFTTQDWNGNPISPDLNRPVEQVSWYDATNYCGKLTARERAAGRLPAGYVYRLPTEAEWEYACRAGTTTATAFGNSLSSTQANFDGDYPYNGAAKGPFLGRTTQVGSYAPNAWGLYDMHGNVWEWCQDWCTDSLPGGSVVDPRGPNLPLTDALRVLRGGCWLNNGRPCRTADRGRLNPDNRLNLLGFRPALASGQ